MFDKFREAFHRQRTMQVEQVKDQIVGYDDIKLFLHQLEQSKIEMNILFNGPRATAKSLFLDELEKRYPNPIRYNCETATGRGLINTIVEFKVEHQTKKMLHRSFEALPITLLLDEVDSMKPKSDLKMLRNLLEGQRIIYTKYRFSVDIRIPKLRVFATSNEAEKLDAPFLSRFKVLHLKEYTLQQFIDISKGIAPRFLSPYRRETMDDIAEEMAVKQYAVDPDVRQLRNLMKMYEVWQGQKTVSELFDFETKYGVVGKK